MPMINKKRARMLLGRKLRLLRFLRGWSQEDLSEACGLHRTHISLIERGVCNISLDNIEKLADAFGLPVHDLLSLSETATSEKHLLSALVESTPKES